MGLRNQLIVLAVAYGLWDIYPLIAPNGFSRDLPSIYDFLISMIIYQPFGEIWFYFNHRLLHKYDWTWSHIHYVCFVFVVSILNLVFTLLPCAVFIY